MEFFRILLVLSLIGYVLSVHWEDTRDGTVYRLAIEQDGTIEYDNDRTFDMSEYLMVGLYPQHPKKRVLIQFEDLPSVCRRIQWAKLYIYFAASYRAPFNNEYQAPEIARPIELYQIHQPWSSMHATTTRRTSNAYWAQPFLDLTGRDAGHQIIDTQVILPNRPASFIEFDVTCSMVHRLGDGENHGYVMRAANEDVMGHEIRWYSDRHYNTSRHAFINVLCDNPGATETEAQIRARCEGRSSPGRDVNVRNRTATPRQGAPDNRAAPPVDTYSRGRADIPLNWNFPDTGAEACDDLLDHCPTTYPSTRRLLPHPANPARYCSCRYCDNVGVTMRDMPCPAGTTFNFNLQECTFPDNCGCA